MKIKRGDYEDKGRKRSGFSYTGSVA